MSRKKSNVNIPLLAALVLLLLTMVSTHFTGGLLARYRSMSAGSDEARVAKFDVKATLELATGEDGTITNVVNEDGTDGTDYVENYTLTVTNNSEVAVEYSIVLCYQTIDEHRYGGFSFVKTIELLDDKDEVVGVGDLDSDPDLIYVPFKNQENQKNQFILDPNSSVDYTLRFSVGKELWAYFTSGTTGNTYAGECEFSVLINATQID